MPEFPPANRIIHRAADRSTPKLARLLREALKGLDIQGLAPILERGNITEVMRSLGLTLDDASRKELAAVLQKVYQDAALPTAASLKMDFAIPNSRAIRWADQRAGLLITEVDAQTIRSISDIVARGIEEGMPPRAQARHIRSLIGLTERWTKAVDNFFSDLPKDTAKELKRAERLRDRYAARLLRKRAEVIARTETLRAAGEGQLQMWKEAEQSGLIDLSVTGRKWLVTNDDRLCAWCMSLNGAIIAFDGVWTTRLEGSGRQFTSLTPPVHPQCRCDEVLVDLAPV